MQQRTAGQRGSLIGAVPLDLHNGVRGYTKQARTRGVRASKAR